MNKVTQPRGRRRPAARPSRGRTPTPPPSAIEDAVRAFLALGITATDLRLRARPGSAFAQLADVMGARAGMS